MAKMNHKFSDKVFKDVLTASFYFFQALNKTVIYKTTQWIDFVQKVLKHRT
jgi:hypothetical protein